MNQKPPSLRLHATGQYMVRWGGRDHYLGTDAGAAQTAYLDHVQQWAEWRENRNTRRFPPLRGSLDVGHAIQRFLAHKELEGGDSVRSYYKKHLARFLRGYSDLRVETIRANHIQCLKDDMLRGGFAARTINHDLTCVRALMAWCAAMEWMLPVSISGVRKMPLGPAPDKSLGWSQVVTMMRAAPVTMRPWLALNYLCLMRPSEVVTVVHGRGEWAQHGVMLIPSKTDRRSPVRRHVVFTESALHWLSLAERIWSRLDSYSQAVRGFCKRGPGALRHTAATHLAQRGAGEVEISRLLGHSPGRVHATYVRTDFGLLRATAGLLAL